MEIYGNHILLDTSSVRILQKIQFFEIFSCEYYLGLHLVGGKCGG